MGYLSVLQVVVQLIICIKLITSQSSTTLRLVEKDATVVGVEPFYNETTFSSTECYLACLQQIDRCFYIETENLNEAWTCKLYNFLSEDFKKYLKPAKGREIVSPYPKKYPKDCVDLKQMGFEKDGVYSISIRENESPRKVFCGMETDGGGWIVIQKRFDGSVDFNRNWTDYRNGFGNIDVNGEYWLGNEFVHQYTSMYETNLILEAVTFGGEKNTTKLQSFKLSDEVSKYIFEFGTCEGLCSLALNKRKFSTPDQDNDGSIKHCAAMFGAWWHKNCFWVNFNGKYSNTNPVPHWTGITWKEFRGSAESLKETKMMVRRI